MNYIKKFIVLLVTSSIILSNTIPVNASTDINNLNDFFTYWVELLDESVNGDRYEEWLKKISKHAFDTAGFLIDETGITIQKIKDAIHGSDNNMPSDMTDQDAYEWIKDNVSVSGNNIVYGDQFNNFVKNYETTYVNDNKINLFYACDLQASQQYISTTGLQDITNIMAEHPNCYYILSRPISNLYLWAVPIGSDKIYGVVRSVYSPVWSNIGLYRCKNVNGILSVDPVMAKDTTNYVYEYDGTNFNLVSDNSTLNMSDGIAGGYFTINKKSSTDGNDWSRYPKALTMNDQSIQVFNDSTALNTYVDNTGIGIESYYYNNTVWQDFSQSTGDYTFSPTNINTVTYGDTVSYVNDYHGTHNEYPDNSTVNNWINTTNNNNTSGGGSGGDDSGGGSDSDDSTDIFGWLKQLGAVIGSLIKGLGEFLTEVLDGIVSALNTLLEGLSSIIKTVTEAIPSVFMEFIEACFDWMPDEWIALLTASLLLMILWGIIKLIRGS